MPTSPTPSRTASRSRECISSRDTQSPGMPARASSDLSTPRFGQFSPSFWLFWLSLSLRSTNCTPDGHRTRFRKTSTSALFSSAWLRRSLSQTKRTGSQHSHLVRYYAVMLLVYVISPLPLSVVVLDFCFRNKSWSPVSLSKSTGISLVE